MLGMCEMLVTSMAANSTGAKKAARKKKRQGKLASSMAATGQRKRKRSRSSSSSSSDTEEEESEQASEEDEPAEGEEGQVARRMEAMEKRLKKDREVAKERERLADEEARQKVRFSEQLLQVKSEVNKERIIFLQKIYADCAAVELDLVGKKIKLRRDVKKRFASVFDKIMKRIAILLVDDRTPGMFAYKQIIEQGETEGAFSKAEVDRMKKFEGQLRTTGAETGRRPRGARNQQGFQPNRPARKLKQPTRGGGGKPQCSFPGCIAAGNTNHKRSECWKDPNSRKHRPPGGQQRQPGAGEVPP